MIPAATSTPRPATRERADHAGAGMSRTPHVGPTGNRTIAGQTQPAATARPVVPRPARRGVRPGCPDTGDLETGQPWWSLKAATTATSAHP